MRQGDVGIVADEDAESAFEEGVGGETREQGKMVEVAEIAEGGGMSRPG